MNPIEISRSSSFKKVSEYLLKGKQHGVSAEDVLTDLTHHKSVFTRRDIAYAIEQKIEDEVERQRLMKAVLSSKDLVTLTSSEADGKSEVFSTWEMVSLEKHMIESAERMSFKTGHGVSDRHVEQALSQCDVALMESAGATLNDEQRTAVYHITGNNNIAVIAGMAGAGKSTMLDAARQAWEAQGYRVYGAALSGKSAEGLEESSHIHSRTLASYEMGWRNGYGELGKGDVLVIDEAGMVGSRQLARFVTEAEERGAKVVLVGDSEQLQAIGAGAPFRAIAERVGVLDLENVLRQREKWQQDATKDFAQQRTVEALKAYDRHGAISKADNREAALESLVLDYMADQLHNPEQSRIALAHRRIDVQKINDAVRDMRLRSGQIEKGITVDTEDGKREFSVGDRLLFLENNYELGVKNGMLSTVISIADGKIQTRLDGKDQRVVEVPLSEYSAVTHGYASTIHKSQGMTVDRSFVMASSTMDRHLAYVAMSRHREQSRLYVGQDEFSSINALCNRLSRSGLKEMTLDYTVDHEKSMQNLQAGATDSSDEKEVGWTQTYNLGNKTRDVDAWRMMQATADSADALKEAAGMNKGRKVKEPVYHYAITWPEDDRPKESLQRLAVKESLKVLGLDQFQAMAVQHLDGKPHVHVMVNLIDPETGMSATTAIKQANGKKASKLTYAHKKLRQWANRFEKKHGLKITEGSRINEEKRQRGEKVDARRKSRVVYEREKREGLQKDMAWFRKAETQKAHDIGERGRALAQKYNASFAKLRKDYAEKMEGLKKQKQQAEEKALRRFTAKFKSNWTTLTRNNHQRLRDFDRSERYASNQVFNAITTYMQVTKEQNNRRKGLDAALSSKERRDLVKRWNEKDKKALAARERREQKAYVARRVDVLFEQKIDRLQKAYLLREERLQRRQSKAMRHLQNEWREYNVSREESYQSLMAQYRQVSEQLNQGQRASQAMGIFKGKSLKPD